MEKFTTAIQKAERRLGKQSQAVLKAKFNLAVILALQERSRESFPLWRSVVQDQLRRGKGGFFGAAEVPGTLPSRYADDPEGLDQLDLPGGWKPRVSSPKVAASWDCQKVLEPRNA